MSDLRLVVGLGNPGPEYRETRHNAGFLLMDQLAAAFEANWSREKKFAAEVADVRQASRRWILVKPQTFMNSSGESVAALVRFHNADLAKLLVVVDDADLPLGSLRLRVEGSSGGHHGLESVEAHLGTRGFARLKLGIARPVHSGRSIAGHVLGKFSSDEWKLFELVLQRAGKQVECWATGGLAKAMSGFNGVVNFPNDDLKNAERKMQ